MLSQRAQILLACLIICVTFNADLKALSDFVQVWSKVVKIKIRVFVLQLLALTIHTSEDSKWMILVLILRGSDSDKDSFNDEKYLLMIQRSITSIDRYSHAICGR